MNVFIVILIILTSFIVLVRSEQRNVLFILADDAGFEAGVYRNKICQTPNIDALAKQSLIFNNAYASASSCSPSRSAILTGQPSHQNGMYGLHHGVHHFNSFDAIKSLPNILRDHGIRTGIIGKKHVGPEGVYKFDYERTEMNNSINQVGRNITHMKLLTEEFLDQTSTPFFLMISFHDPHRCGHTNPEYGEFCQNYGNGDPGMGRIPDWTPIIYQPEQIELPYFIQDTLQARIDVAHQYTTISRLDQGIGLILKTFKDKALLDDTLVIYTSDNGIPFAAGRTNVYDSGMAVPMLMSSPFHQTRRNQVTYAVTSLLDILPTVLDWFEINDRLNLTGKSLLPLLDEEPPKNDSDAIYASQTHHEVTMYYPMRAIRTNRYKVVHNINYGATFPLDQDLFVSSSFQDLLNRTRAKQPTGWYRTLDSYLKRSEWEFFDVKHDPEEVNNLFAKPTVQRVFDELKKKLIDWQRVTTDPWICAPHGVLENVGNDPQCFLIN